MTTTGSRRRLRIGLIVLAIVVLVPAAGLALLSATFDPNAYKPRIAEAVKRATGRDLELAGPIALKFGLHPSIETRDVALANIEGGSRPQMVKVARIDAQIALVPLLSRQVEIDRLVLVRPDILLETTADGRPNWRFGPAVPSQVLPQPEIAAPGKAPPPQIALQDMRIEDGTLAYREGKKGRTQVLAVQTFQATASSAEAPVTIALSARYNDAPLAANGEVGPLVRLLAADSPTPWPVRLNLASAGATVDAAGTLTHPLQAQGYDLKVQGTVPDLAALQPFYPRASLPPVRDLSFAAQVADSGGRIPDVSALTLRTGASDLSVEVPGLTVTKLDVSAPRLDQPVHASAEGQFSGAPLRVVASLGAPALLIPGSSAAGPFPVDISGEAAGARIAAKGGIADPAHWSGLDLALLAQVPDLAALSPLARRPLPALKDIAFQARAAERGGGLAHGVTLRDAKLTLPQADVAGTASLGFGGHP
ncbi:MAG: AsmA family protein, partial [Acetobacteraceae bacterium]|nr:AsmA family protein [Acetobacteraceae bacterium]